MRPDDFCSSISAAIWIIGIGGSLGMFVLSFIASGLYINILGPRHDYGRCWWFWLGYWPLVITTALAFANLFLCFLRR